MGNDDKALHRDRRSGNWYAWVKAWDGEKWKWMRKSTRLSDQEKAAERAREMQALADLGGPKGIRDRQKAYELVESILGASGGISESWESVAEAWLQMRGARVKESSLRRYRSHVNNFNKWLDEKRTMAVAAIDLQLAQRYYDYLSSSGLALKTCNENIKTLSAVCERAVAQQVMYRNPWPGVERRYGGKKKREPFTAEDVTMLLKACDNGKRTKPHARDWKRMIYLGLCTGARAGDCCAMQWEDFRKEEQESGETLVTLTYSPEKKEGKNDHAKREVTIPVIEPLRSHLLQRWKTTGPLCPSLVNTPVSSRGGISQQFQAIAEQAKIPMKITHGKGRGHDFRSKTFHSFRHTLNSALYNQGVPDEWRMKILDHESEAVNRGYSHADVATMREFMKGVKLGL